MSGARARRFGAGAPLFPLAVLCAFELMDQVTKSAYGVLTPDLRDAFHLTDGGILAVSAVGDAAALCCTVPIALLADRSNRVRLVLIGATVAAAFTFGLGLAPTAALATLALAGLRMGQAVIFPTHNSLLADYYPAAARPRIYAAHGGAKSLGVVIGVLAGAGLATAFSWRAPFLVFACPVLVVVAVGLRLREPRRGGQETGEPVPHHPPSFGEAWRMVWKIRVLRRMFFALPMLAVAVVGFDSLASLQYKDTFHLGAEQRAFLSAPVQVFHLAGLAIGAYLATRLMARGMRRVFTLLGVAAMIAAGCHLLFALAPSVPVAFVANAGIEASFAVVTPGVFAALALAIPARVRSIGFAITALFVLPGLVVLPVVGVLGQHVGFRFAMLLLVPVFVAGGLVIASAGGLVDQDVRNARTSAQARARMLAELRAGQAALLAVQDLAAGYGGAPVLEHVEIEVGEGEIVALLGTNGSGKSTLLRAIGGIVEADDGAVVFDGRDITHMPPDAIGRLGIAQVPGGEGVFPTLTVEENLRAAAWTRRPGQAPADPADEAFVVFPELAGRRADRAGHLSGGQQQMLAVAMALLARPRLLLIDELSLGLAPAVVERLLAAVRALRDRGIAVLLVEQSVDVAASVADRAYVLDNGTVRFCGSAQEIGGRPELLRAIVLDQAGPMRPLPRPAVAPAGPGATGPGATGTALEVIGARVSFGGITALDDVSLTAGRGEVVGIIGPNGAGKTTLFDVVSGFTRPAAGRIVLHGLDVTRRSPAARARLGLGRSFQDARLFGGLCVREVLAVALERFIDVRDPVNAMLRPPAHQVTEAAVTERVDEILARFGLESQAERLVSELSTGWRRLLDLAAVVAHQPDVVLLDEPSSGVAQKEVEFMLGVLRSVRDQLDATVLVVEHDIGFVRDLADRLIVLDRGRVLASGAPDEVLAAAEVREAFLPVGALARPGPGADASARREPR